MLDTLKSAAAPNEAAPTITRAEVEEAVKSLKDSKLQGRVRTQSTPSQAIGLGSLRTARYG